MTDITPPVPSGAQIIQSYGDGRFRIGGVEHAGSVLVLPGLTVAWDIADPKSITEETIAPLLETEAAVELILLGCGKSIAPVNAELRAVLRARGIGVEPMDTGAACRTFNVLLSEQRAVAAALIAV
jgi:uncharacterized protein